MFSRSSSCLFSYRDIRVDKLTLSTNRFAVRFKNFWISVAVSLFWKKKTIFYINLKNRELNGINVSSKWDKRKITNDRESLVEYANPAVLELFRGIYRGSDQITNSQFAIGKSTIPVAFPMVRAEEAALSRNRFAKRISTKWTDSSERSPPREMWNLRWSSRGREGGREGGCDEREERV